MYAIVSTILHTQCSAPGANDDAKLQTCSVCMTSVHGRCMQRILIPHFTDGAVSSVFGDFNFEKDISEDFKADRISCLACQKVARRIAMTARCGSNFVSSTSLDVCALVLGLYSQGTSHAWTGGSGLYRCDSLGTTSNTSTGRWRQFPRRYPGTHKRL